MDDVLDLGFFDDFEEEEPLPITQVSYEMDTQTYLERSHNYWMQVPLPAESTPAGTNPLASMSDDDLLKMSPTLVAHVQRTSAMNGMQVISPRAISLASLAARTNLSKRTTDMFVVGSNASRNDTWPVLVEPVPEHLFEDEPIDSYPSEVAPRPKVISSGIMGSTSAVSDPITRAFLYGRALVDLQRRSDVAGAAEELSDLIASCWGLDPDVFSDMAEASLAPTGDLLRYAIRSDEVYPIVNAPIQARKCISVGANTAGRHLYGEFAGLDWRRLRVLCEAVFYQSVRTEGYGLIKMALGAPPGDPRAPPDRPGVIQMRPLPGSVWTHNPSTFRLDLESGSSIPMAINLPSRIAQAVSDFYQTARPVAMAADLGVLHSLVETETRDVQNTQGESLVSGYKKLLTTAAAFSARGKTSSAAVRGFLYDTLASNTSLSAIRALWMTRYFRDTIKDMEISYLMDHTVTKHVASRMTDVSSDMRVKLSVEAGRKGSSLDEWWKDIASLLPREIASMTESTTAWSLAMAHLLLNPPTTKWINLTRAMAHASHESMALAHRKTVRLPAIVGSMERSFEAGATTTRFIGTSYGAYYEAMYDVACVLEARLRRAGNNIGAQKVKLAGLMWDIRSKVASTVKLHRNDGTKTAAGTYIGRHGTYHFTTAPHSAYTRWHKYLNESAAVGLAAKKDYPHHAQPVISKQFDGRENQLFRLNTLVVPRLFRYAMNPSTLAKDIEKTLQMMMLDVGSVIRQFDDEHLEQDYNFVTMDSEVVTGLELDMTKYVPHEGSYWDTLTTLETSVAADIVDSITRLDESVMTEIEEGTYASGDELLKAVHLAEQTEALAKKQSVEAVS